MTKRARGSWKRIIQLTTLVLGLGAGLTPSAHAIEEASPMHWSGSKTVWDRKSNRVEIYGSAAVHQPGETITADTIILDLDSRTLDAKGNCVYISAGSVMYGEEMHFNMDTRTGTIVGGRVTNDQFSLAGERINKLGPGRFQTHQGSYSTCRDCPNSWTLFADDVDMEFDGYGFMSNVKTQIKDAPVFWVPYLIVPLKTRRQTGFLFPRLGFRNNGVTFVQPFFWAAHRSADMTVAAGHFAERGLRLEAEGRYQASERSAGTINAYYLKDKKFIELLEQPGRKLKTPVQPHRWALYGTETQELPFKIDQKFRVLEMSDNFYPSGVGDVPGAGEAFVNSEDLSFSRPGEDVSAFVAGRWYRNILSSNTDPREFDPSTVHVVPTALVTTNDHFLFNSPIASGVSLGLTRFTRNPGPIRQDTGFSPYDIDLFANDPLARVNPIREATRVTVTPTLYTTIRPWNSFAIVPSIEYRNFFYSFPQGVAGLNRSYVLFQTDFTTQFDRIYETSDPDIPRLKHSIRPLLTYSLIPPAMVRRDGNHPFENQIQYAFDNGFSGYNFDNHDIVPMDQSTSYSNYFVPLGNSLTFGLTTQLTRRRGVLTNLNPSYQRTVEVKTGSTFNFRELNKWDVGQTPKPWSRAFVTTLLSYDKFGGSIDYAYIPYAPIDETRKRNTLSTTLGYTFERAVHQSVLAFERSVSVGYTYNKTTSLTDNLRFGATYSLNDYIMPASSVSYDFLGGKVGKVLGVDGSLTLQSPSRCWKFIASGGLNRCVATAKDGSKKETLCSNFGVSMQINLTGAGFGNVTDLAESVIHR